MRGRDSEVRGSFQDTMQYIGEKTQDFCRRLRRGNTDAQREIYFFLKEKMSLVPKVRK